MSAFFLDASALVKRFAPEVGSAWIRTLTDDASGHEIVLAEISLVEVSAALSAKTRLPGGLSLEHRDRALSVFLMDCRDRFLVAPTSRDIIDLAVELTQRQPLRAYDAVQLASGLVVNNELLSQGLPALVFVSADARLLDVAAAENLQIDDPHRHP